MKFAWHIYLSINRVWCWQNVDRHISHSANNNIHTKDLPEVVHCTCNSITCDMSYSFTILSNWTPSLSRYMQLDLGLSFTPQVISTAPYFHGLGRMLEVKLAPEALLLPANHRFPTSTSTSMAILSLSCKHMFFMINYSREKNAQYFIITRQHSTQSVGNMPPPSPPHLLPQVLQIMPRNPKYDQFQPKGHHNEENPQSTTKMPGNPKFYPFH